VIPKKDRELVKGIIINRFRGDADLFKTGIEIIEKKTGLPVLGLIPYFHHIQIDSEDGLPLDFILDPPCGPEPGKINIGVIRLPHISNFTDFNPFERDASVNLHYLARPRGLYGYDAVFLPGTKNGRFDMDWLRDTGWADSLSEFFRTGGRLCGICGGYQLLGKLIRDPHGIEGTPGDTLCLGLLDAETTLHEEKILSRSTGIWQRSGENIEGYEIHMGITECGPGVLPVIRILSQNGEPADSFDGAARPDGRVWGTYFHGLFDVPGFRHSFLKMISNNYNPGINDPEPGHVSAFKDRQYDMLAEHFRAHLDMDTLFAIAGFDKETGNLIRTF
jgi:adenosylcobyric acid synthase